MSKSYKFRVGQKVTYNDGSTAVDVTVTGISYSKTKGQFYSLSNGAHVKQTTLTAITNDSLPEGKVPPTFPLPGESCENWPDAPQSVS